jgi:tRNA pseudouridine55 synthase
MAGLMERPTSSTTEQSEPSPPVNLKFRVPRGGALVIDKPQGWTSHDVVARSRRLLSEKRIGHTGTLDPMATGVLVLLVGKATRLAPYLACDRKTYTCTAKFGLSTDTQDITGQTVGECDAGHLTHKIVEEALGQFRGAILQRPPQYSAVKVDGKRLYASARKGEHVEVPERPVEIFRFELVSWQSDDTHPMGSFLIECSAGTYIRTLLHDLGAKLGVGATLTELRRTSAGRFALADAVNLEQLGVSSDQGNSWARVLPMAQLVADLPIVSVNDQQVEQIYFGRALAIDSAENSLASLSHQIEEGAHEVALVHEDLGLVAVGKIDGDVVQPHLVLVEAMSATGSAN